MRQQGPIPGPTADEVVRARTPVERQRRPETAGGAKSDAPTARRRRSGGWRTQRSRWSALLLCGCAAAFAPRAAPPRHRPAPTCTELHCICVNCAFVDNCTAYHVVEAKHGQPHVAEKPIFTPREGSPTVAVNIFPPDSVNKAKGFEIELDVVECADFAREMGKWRKMMPPGTLVKAGFDPDYEPP